MKKNKKFLTTSIALTLVGVGAVTATGCSCSPDKPKDEVAFGFSIALASGKNELRQGSTDQIVVHTNGVGGERSYQYFSTDPSKAIVDINTGAVTIPDDAPIDNQSFTFYVKEANTPNPSELIRPVKVITKNVGDANGGFNYANAADDAAINKRTEILGKLEKYAMDKHLTGITLFDNGGYVRYADRVNLSATNGNYVTGYGFGLLTEGSLDLGEGEKKGKLPGTDEAVLKYPDYLHSSISQDSLKVNQYSATGSQVSDLAGYITSSYWGTKLVSQTKYDWCPVLATEEVDKPKVDAAGNVIGFEGAKTVNDAPIPMELSDTGMYRKWRIYVKTDGVNDVNLKFHQYLGRDELGNLIPGPYNGRSITINDYLFPYKLLLTGSNALIRGTEMANDSSYGIKGAARYYSDTQKMTDSTQITNKFNEDIAGGKLGLKTGNDKNGDYLDIELINAIDSFTAMYTLSSSLVSPLPEEMFIGPNAIAPNFHDSATFYGTFNNEIPNDAILKYTVACGPFTLEKWDKNSQIIYTRNDDWFEHVQGRYKIPGVHFRVLNTQDNANKLWEYFEAGNLDSVGVPTDFVKQWKNDSSVKKTEGDSTFKLNVNSCTQEQWDEKFGPNGSISANSTWNVKPWMSNSSFLDGLFYSIDREAFADKRGVDPSVNYFSNSYMSNPKAGVSYNSTDAHKAAVEGYAENYGYNLDKAIACFRNAVSELSSKNQIPIGTRDNPETISIHIRWMYQTDIREYGDDIKAYFERAFNDDAVCGGKVKLNVEQEAVSNWEEVYNEWMMKGQFDLGFGAISGNSYNPLNFMEVLKSDNSSSFTLNWGADTGIIDPLQPIVYDDGSGAGARQWSYDGLWEVADHGGILDKGTKVNPIKKCKFNVVTDFTRNGLPLQDPTLYNSSVGDNSFDVRIPIQFVSFSGGSNIKFDVSRVDCYVHGKPNETLASKGDPDFSYDPSTGNIIIHVTNEKAKSIHDLLRSLPEMKDPKPGEEWKLNPFRTDKYKDYFDFEVYYTATFGGVTNENFVTVSI